MDEEMEFEFNEKITKALMKRVQDTNTKCAVLEKDLGVKQAELQYLAKLYDEETTSLTQELENEKKKATKYEEELNEIKAKLIEKYEEILDLTSKVDNFNNKNTSMEQEIEKLRNELEGANTIIEEQITLYEALQMELKEYKGPEAIVDDTSNGDRLKCYKCGSVGKDIKVVEDKSKALSYVGNIPMYAKYNVCKKCGYQF